MGKQVAAKVLQAEVRCLVQARCVDPGRVAPPEFAHDIQANEYGLYCVPRAYRTREVPRVLASGQVYEPNTLRFMQRMVGSGDTVSGGAFVGDFFPALSRGLVSGAMLHSFEPNPVTHAAACQTIALNCLGNVCLARAAVGEAHDTLPLQVSRPGTEALAAGARIVAKAVDGQTIDVPVVPLDDLIAPDRHISILHLDIEGHEAPALKGAKGIIRRCRPIIILEAAKPRVQRQYIRLLRQTFPKLRYRPAGLMERNAIFIPGRD